VAVIGKFTSTAVNRLRAIAKFTDAWTLRRSCLLAIPLLRAWPMLARSAPFVHAADRGCPATGVTRR
jgi:hypothetical protein